MAKPVRHLIMQMPIFSVFLIRDVYKLESISEKMNNDNDLNLHSMSTLWGWLRYWVLHVYLLLI